MYCPVCKDKALVMSERQGIEIDYCANCRGVWLDRGELDKIIQKSQELVPPPSSSVPQQAAYRSDQYQQKDHYHDNRYRSKKKESFWKELFD